MPAFALLPLAALYAVIVGLRRALYRLGWFPSVVLPIPVVIVGNITVGGVGKTPLTIFLVEELKRLGWNPGVVSRGYGRQTSAIAGVTTASSPAQVGDEPLLIARRTGAPVVVGRDRVAAAQALLDRYPTVDIIISDDGLQHYRLARSVEIAVFDGRGLMNGWPLPAGPLREPAARLRHVDAVVINQAEPLIAVPPAQSWQRPQYAMRLEAGEPYRLGTSAITTTLDRWRGQSIHAVAGIGNPQRFFDQLQLAGLDVVPHAFPDHHAYATSDLPIDGRAILTTEKDAVKLAALALDKALEIWVLPVHCRVTPDHLVTQILEKVRGSPTA